MTTCADKKCRIFNAFIKSVDGKEEKDKKAEKGLFGKCLGEFTTLGWVWGCSFSPSGKKVAYVSHDSTISYVNWTEENAQPITLKLTTLPFRSVQFLSEDIIIAGGFDYSPFVFSCSDKLVMIGRADGQSGGGEEKQTNRVVNKFQTNTTEKKKLMIKKL